MITGKPAANPSAAIVGTVFGFLSGPVLAQDAVTLNEVTAVDAAMVTTEDITLGDLNGDGLIDVVLSPNFGQAQLFLNNGTADPFAGVAAFEPAGANAISGAAIGDLNGDNHNDIAFRRFNGRTRVFFNTGDPVAPFAGVPAVDVSLDTDSSTSIELADMNGDGNLDVVVGNTNIAANRLYLNNGTPDPFAGVTGLDIGPNASYTTDIVIADVDDDGHLDVAVANDLPGFGPLVEVLLNNGSADPFAGVSPIGLGTGLGYGSVEFADVNNDGLVDLLAGPYQDSRSTEIYLNTGLSVPFDAADLVTVPKPEPGSAYALIARDMNLDGAMDLVNLFYPETGPAQLQVLLGAGGNDPFATRVPLTVELDFPFQGLGVSDLNGDLVPDVVVGDGSESGRVFLGAIGPDTVPPLVMLTEPENGEAVFGTIAVSAFAGDNLSLGSVVLLANELVVEVLTEAPFTFEFDTFLVPNGLAAISAVATDTAGNIAADSVTVTVANVVDTDNDFIPDSLDNCLLVANSDQRDTDDDGIGNFCDADLNNDCAINFQDLEIIKSVFFASDADADFDGDGAVNFVDLNLMVGVFFGVPGPSGTTNICAP